MDSANELKAAAWRRGQRIKRNNAITAILSGGLPALYLATHFRAHPLAWVAGFFGGLLWANLFEYLYHRFLLHVPINFLMERHMQHHRALGKPDEADHTNFGGSPLDIFLLFLINGGPVVLLDWLAKGGFAPGVLIAFVIYFVAVEEIHWRIHLGGWLPPGFEKAKAFHLTHHHRPNSRYSVFCPLFDWLLGTTEERPRVPRPSDVTWR